MVEKMSSDSGNRATNALHRRAKAIKDWEISATAKEKTVRLPAQFTIQFDQGTVFLSAVASGEIDETKNLLDDGVDIDFTNVDGLTALHQACIDENSEMVELLLERGANIEARDNEGWTPLHAAASAGIVDIAKILIDFGADLAAVNNEGEVPLDLAEEEEMEEFLSDEIDAQDLEVEEARNEEERLMLDDANSWLNQNKIEETLDWQGATALHVAASKGYNKVISLLLQIGSYDVNVRDDDGWTPLHAAVHWGSKTATELLTEAGANFDLKNNNGQTPCDLAEPEFVKTAENCRKRAKELAKKPNFAKNKRIDVNIDLNENSIQQIELLAVENLKKDPTRSAIKGGRANAKNGNNKGTVKTNDNDNNNKKTDLSESGSNTDIKPSVKVTGLNTDTKSSAKVLGSNSDTKSSSKVLGSNSDTKPSVKVTLNTSKPEPVTINTKVKTDTKESKTNSLGSRFGKTISEPEKQEEITTTTRPSVNSRLNNRPYAISVGKTEEKKPEGGLANRYKASSKEETSNETPIKTFSYTSSLRKTNNTETPATPSSTYASASRAGSGSDWRSRLAERSKDAENDDIYSKPKSYQSSDVSVENSSNETDLTVPQQETETQNERVSPSSRRVAHRNLRETRRSTGVVFLPEKEDNSEDENDSTTPSTATDTSDNSRLSIADRLRKKNEQLISSSYTSNYTSSTSKERDTTTNPSTRFGSRLSSSSSTTSSDTGDTKELQRKLDTALKEVQDYKTKYEKIKQEKEDLQVKLEQYKEDIDKMQELKNDNLRLKDENGALIRVISKLSRTPAS